MSPRRRFAPGVAVLLLGSLCTFRTPGTAGATTLTPASGGHEKVIVLASGGVAVEQLAVERLAPGGSVTQPFRLRLPHDVLAGRPAVLIERVRNLERGCNHPEQAVGDTSCGTGDDQGELADQLLAGITWQPATQAPCLDAPAPTTSSMASLVGTTLGAADPVAATAGDACLLLTLSLPHSADNLVQTDAVSFDLQIGLLDAVHQGDAGAAVARGSAGGALTAGVGALPGGEAVLPFTGAPLVPVALVAMGLLQLALVALAIGRRGAGSAPGP